MYFIYKHKYVKKYSESNYDFHVFKNDSHGYGLFLWGFCYLSIDYDESCE